jgi:hypothetical protein
VVDYTPYLRLAKPPFDDIPWDEAVNGNMDILDAFNALYMSVPNFTGVWTNSTTYVVGQNVLDNSVGRIFTCLLTHTSTASPTTFAQDRITYPTYWVLSSSSPAVSTIDYDVGRNKIHNGSFGVWQRGFGPFTTLGYTADRWKLQFIDDAPIVTKEDFDDADRVELGDEAALYFLRTSFAGGSNAASYTVMRQAIESLPRLSNKVIAISFWARALAPINLGVNLVQYAGGGGSGGGYAQTPGLSFAVTTVWQRFTAVVIMPSFAGGVLGTDHFTGFDFYYSSGADLNTVSGNIGAQSGQIDLYGVQVEFGGVATQFERLEPALQLINCQRFYQKFNQVLIAGYGTAGGSLFHVAYFLVAMRDTPLPTITFNGGANTSGHGVDTTNTQLIRLFATVVALGPAFRDINVALSADLG